jgi:hypothetical protein
MKDEIKPDLILCSCNSADHLYIVRYDEGDENWGKNVYIEPHLQTGGFFERLKIGLKYIFGWKCRYGDFDEIIIDEDNYHTFKKIVDFFEKDEK